MKNQITAQRLREALNESCMRQEDLANASGVSKASISQYINGSHSPSNISSGKMASVLGVNPLWLMGFDVMKNSPSRPGGAVCLSEFLQCGDGGSGHKLGGEGCCRIGDKEGCVV